MTTRAPVVLKKFDPRQKRKGLKAWSSGFLKETKLLEIPDPKITFCQNLKRITLFPIMPSLSSAIIFVYHHMKSIMEKDRPSSTLWRNNNSHIIENQCGLGIGGSMVKEALPVGSMLIAQFVITICTICYYNFEFAVFVFSHHRKSMRAGDWGNMVGERGDGLQGSMIHHCCLSYCSAYA